MISVNSIIQHVEVYALVDSGNGFVEGVIFENNMFRKVEFNKQYIVRSYELAKFTDERFEDYIKDTYGENSTMETT